MNTDPKKCDQNDWRINGSILKFEIFNRSLYRVISIRLIKPPMSYKPFMIIVSKLTNIIILLKILFQTIVFIPPIVEQTVEMHPIRIIDQPSPNSVR